MGNPQNTRYYDWILDDAKDAPYATFRFHYRSWEYLQASELIPEKHPRKLLKASNSTYILSGHLKAKPLRVDEKSKSDHRNDNDTDEPEDRHHEDNEALSQLVEKSDSFTSAITESRGPSGKILSQTKENVATGYLKAKDSRHELSTLANKHTQNEKQRQGCSSQSAHVALSFPIDYEDRVRNRRVMKLPMSQYSVSQNALNEWPKRRPLPEVPPRNSSLDHSRQSSKSSLTSMSPSLRSWAERECSDSEAEIKMATSVSLKRIEGASSSIHLEDISFRNKQPSRLVEKFDESRSDTASSYSSSSLQPAIGLQPAFAFVDHLSIDTSPRLVPSFSRNFLSSNSMNLSKEEIFASPQPMRGVLNPQNERKQTGLFDRETLRLSDSFEADEMDLEDPFESPQRAPTEAEWISPKKHKSRTNRAATSQLTEAQWMSPRSRGARLRRGGIENLKIRNDEDKLEPMKMMGVSVQKSVGCGSPSRPRAITAGAAFGESPSRTNWI
jgi:hypothetical protein